MIIRVFRIKHSKSTGLCTMVHSQKSTIIIEILGLVEVSLLTFGKISSFGVYGDGEPHIISFIFKSFGRKNNFPIIVICYSIC